MQPPQPVQPDESRQPAVTPAHVEAAPANTTETPPSEPFDMNKTQPNRSEGRRSLISTIFIVCSAIVVALLLTTYVFQSYQVDGPSMEPTLHNGDRLIVWKTPRTLAKITGNQYVPHRGDVVIFVERGLLSPDGSARQLVKRVIALPGERVTIKNGETLVFNKEHPDGFNPDTTLAYGNGLSLTMSSSEDPKLITVPEDSVYVLGDNRGNSTDSRVFSPVPVKDIVGKLVLRMFPLGDAQVF